jgi:hypothetical protein
MSAAEVEAEIETAQAERCQRHARGD